MTENAAKAPGRWPKRVRTPMLLQLEGVECGAAALGIILGYYGRIVPLATLRQDCGVSRDGSKASNVVKAARRYGMVAKGFRKELEALQSTPTPYIVFWYFNHFLVVEGFKGDKVYLSDPADGHRVIDMHEFDRGFTGVVLDIRPGDDFVPGGKKPSVAAGLLRRLGGAWSPILLCAIAGILLAIPGLVIPTLTKIFLDDVVVDKRVGWLQPLLWALVVATAAQALLRYIQTRYLRTFKIALAARMSSAFIRHLFRLPVAFYQQRFPGEVSNRVRINDQVADILSGELARAVVDAVTLVLYLALMLSYDVWLSVIALCAAALNIASIRWVAAKRAESATRRAASESRVASVEVEGLQRIETIKSSGDENGFFGRWSGLQATAINTRQDAEVRNSLVGLVPTLISTLATMLVLCIGGWRVIDGVITLGTLVAFQGLMQSFLAPVKALVQLASTVQALQGGIERLDDVLQHETSKVVGVRANADTALDRPRLRGEIEIRNLTFGYSRLEDPLIQDFSVTVKPGQRIALVGGSGSGKSTVARLLTGQFEPWSGDILFDGEARERVPRTLLCNSLALVDQDITLYQGTVRENLTLWDESIPDDGLLRACADAEILDKVELLPGGLDADLREQGANLSGGQRQRLEIARSLVNDPSILVLDEATSALDAETEFSIAERIRLRGCTCVLIAHRLSTIRDCDEILVLERGKVVERGTHKELWDKGEVYARLLGAEAGVAEASA